MPFLEGSSRTTTTTPNKKNMMVVPPRESLKFFVFQDSGGWEPHFGNNPCPLKALYVYLQFEIVYPKSFLKR